MLKKVLYILYSMNILRGKTQDDDATKMYMSATKNMANNVKLEMYLSNLTQNLY